MEEGKGSGGGDSSGGSSKFLKSRDRQMFSVELRPFETTIVSWKKLMRDANKTTASTSGSEPAAKAHPVHGANIDAGQPAEKEEKDGPMRFSAVIEKIERLYMGKHSSDEEDLNDIPDDDEYDTEDSFIDDAELDEYFEVDNSAIKHDGFFVNRGNLERINAPPTIMSQQPRKRKRKDLTKVHGDSNNDLKHVKVSKKTSGKAEIIPGNSLSGPSRTVYDEHSDGVKVQNQVSASEISSKKQSTDSKVTLDLSTPLKLSNGDASLFLAQKTGTMQLKSTGKLKDRNGLFDAVHQKYIGKSTLLNSKSQSGRPLDTANDVQMKDINGSQAVLQSEGRYSTPCIKASHANKKDGSNVRPKGNILEKAIRELEKMVAESRPPAVEHQDADTSLQAVKRRLPREIKLKLAKVARLAQASHGKISNELINRLMSILGHLMQLNTLKRNLRIMINTGLSAKQEKDHHFQQIKKETQELINKRLATLVSKTFDHQVGASDDFQEHSSEQKGRKVNMDTLLEDKICDLYDLYVDGLEEDAAPQIRKLYAELAELWPNGIMDNHGIKRGICRAKERRRVLYSSRKDQENFKRKKVLTPRAEETGRLEGISVESQVRECMPTDSSNLGVSSSSKRTDSSTPGISSSSKPIPNTTAAVRVPSPSVSGSRPKPEKLKGTPINFPDNPKVVDGPLAKKKVKRKPELDMGEASLRPCRTPSQQVEERENSHNQAAAAPANKPNIQSTAPHSL